MIELLLMMAASAPAAPVDQPADQRMARIAALYADVCLKAFPGERAVDAAMLIRNGQQLPPEAVKVTMRDDPARAWYVKEEDATVWLELPPVRACSVRWSAAEEGSAQFYQAAIANYKSRVGEFMTMPPQSIDRGDIHVSATGETRALPDQSLESLFFIIQSVNDPKRRAAGETGMVLRYVHQIAPSRGSVEK